MSVQWCPSAAAVPIVCRTSTVRAGRYIQEYCYENHYIGSHWEIAESSEQHEHQWVGTVTADFSSCWAYIEGKYFPVIYCSVCGIIVKIEGALKDANQDPVMGSRSSSTEG